MREASATASETTFSEGQTRLTRPSAMAREASNGSPRSPISSANARGILAGRRVPPPPGTKPLVTSGRPNLASSAATARSHLSMSSKPPPIAIPLTAATIGSRWCERIKASNRLNPAPAPLGSERSARRSIPELKHSPPAPVMTAAPVPSSAVAASIASERANRVAGLSALRTSGLSIVSSKTRPTLEDSSATPPKSVVCPAVVDIVLLSHRVLPMVSETHRCIIFQLGNLPVLGLTRVDGKTCN